LKYSEVDHRVILKLIFYETALEIWSGYLWHRVVSSGMFFLTQ